MREALSSAVTMWVIAWRANRLKMSIALGLTILFGMAWPMFALLLKVATGAVIARDVDAATLAGLGMSVVAIGALMFNHFAYVPYAEATETAVVSLESELLELANGSADLEHLERPEYADKFVLVQQEISGFSFGMIGLMTTVSLTISMTITGVLLASVSPWLLLLALAAIPPLITARLAQKVVDGAKEDGARTQRQALHLFRLSTSAGSAMELRVSRLQAELRRRHAALWAKMGTGQWRAERRSAAIGASGQVFFALAYVVAVLLVVRQAIAGRSGVGDVFLVIVLAAQVNQQVNSGLEQFRRLQRMASGLTRLRWLRTLVRDDKPAEATVEVPGRIRTGLELRDVTFRYPATAAPVLRDINLTLPAGSLVALVGENGAGKTTLVKLLCRLYECTTGEISLDGVDIRRFPLDDWRRHTAAAFQDFARFELLARETVGVGELPLIDDEPAVRTALARARADDVIEQLESGLHTHLGKTYRDGAELSGGQWQKLALGRAMMRERPLILVLDEPTSALDAQAEHRLFEQYAESARRLGRETGAITVLVSHRFSTASMADLILVIDDGQIREAGDHAALLAQGGLYAQLYTLQAGAYQRS